MCYLLRLRSGARPPRVLRVAVRTYSAFREKAIPCRHSLRPMLKSLRLSRGAAQLRLEAKRTGFFAQWGISEQLSQNSSTHTSAEHRSQCTENEGFWYRAYLVLKFPRGSRRGTFALRTTTSSTKTPLIL